MSEQASSPVLSEGVAEVQGVFPSDAALQAAIAQLTLAGFDRADLSLPDTSAGAAGTPDAGAANPMTEVDVRQARTMGTSMAATAGAMAAAGATIATGGAAALAIAAAAAVGGGAALAANAAGNAAEDVQSSDRESAAAQGRLVLAVHAPTAAKQEEAVRIMRSAGATETGANQATGIDSAGWTG